VEGVALFFSAYAIMANKWVEHIKSWALKNKKTYGCALSDPKCKEAYQANKNRPKSAFAMVSEDTEKNTKLKNALKEWYKAQDDNFEAFNTQNKKGDIVENKSAFKALGDNLAKKYGLPKTWLKEAMKL
tara:strand:+ start:720 stop:1106 length:387 start_codon:yes stop_codon:yes gene_type:complete